MTITIYHNPDCGTSRNVLAMIRNSGEEPRVVEYLKTPPSRDELIELPLRIGRLQNPILMNRPVVVTELGVKLRHPADRQKQPVGKEDRPVTDLSWRHSMADKVYNVLFLCTGNSARSIMAECAISRWGQGRFRGFSAGSRPKGEVHPMALRLLERLNYRTEGLRSKSWNEFAAGTGPALGFVFTVCDQAAGEVCPAWPGQPMTAHWGVQDPAAFVGTDEQSYKLFRNIYGQLENRIKIFASLPIRSLDKLTLQQRLEEIGRSRETATTS